MKVRVNGRLVLNDGDDCEIVAVAATSELATEMAARLNTHQAMTDVVKEVNEWVEDVSAYVRRGEPMEDFTLLAKRFTPIRKKLRSTIAMVEGGC